MGTAILIGLIAAGVGVSRGEIPISPILGCAVVGIVALVALTLGIADHQVRYFTPAMPFLALASAPGLVWLGSRLPRPSVVVAAGLALLVGLALAVIVVRDIRVQDEGLADSHRQAAAELATQPCIVLSRSPSNGWYSGCDTGLFPMERRWANGEPRSRGIGDRERMLGKIRSQMMGLTANGDDPEIYIVASDPPHGQEPKGAARQLLLNLLWPKLHRFEGLRPPFTFLISGRPAGCWPR